MSHNFTERWSIKLFGCSVAALLAGCSGDGGTSTVGAIESAPGAPALTASILPMKTLSFSWGAVSDTDHYELYENADTMSGYSQVGDSIAPSETSIDLYTSLVLNREALYLLSACNNIECTDSASVTKPTDVTALNAAIGQFSASSFGGAALAADQFFGYDIAISDDGSVMVVGAFRDNQSEGAAYVYTRSGTEWQFEQKLVAGFPGANDDYGRSVDISADGTLIVVSARQEDSNHPDTLMDPTINSQSTNNVQNSGAVYVYTKTSSVWAESEFIKAPSTFSTTGLLFGDDVSISADGKTLAVGASSYNGSRGAVFVYEEAQGAWQHHEILQNPLPNQRGAVNDGDYFGHSVDLNADGTRLAIGVPLADYELPGILTDLSQFDGSRNVNLSMEDGYNSGVAMTYEKVAGLNGPIWEFEALFKPTVVGYFDDFGGKVKFDASGDRLVVAAKHERSINNDPNNDQAFLAGAAYVFDRDDVQGWQQSAFLKASNAGAEDQFGRSIDMSSDGRVIVVGAFREDGETGGIRFDTGDTANNARAFGAAYVFEIEGTAWSQVAILKSVEPESNGQFGIGIAVSGDGSTIAVGGYNENSDSTITDNSGNEVPEFYGSGKVYLY